MDRGLVVSLRARLAVFVADPVGIVTGAARLLHAAELFHESEPDLEQRTLLRAFDTALSTQRAMEGTTLDELGRRLAAGATVADGMFAVALAALSSHVLDPYEVAAPRMRAALTMLEACPDTDLLDLGSFGVALGMGLWDDAATVSLLERMIRAGQDAGNLRSVDTALWVLGLVDLVRGDITTAGRRIEAVRELRRAMGYDAEQVVNGSYLAWSGAPVEVVEAVAEGNLAAGFGGVWTATMTGLGVRQIADGHYRDAFDRLRPMVEQEFLQVTYQQLPDLVEAGVRCGRGDQVVAATARLVELAQVTGTPWVRGVAARTVALTASPDDAEALYLEAIEHLGRSTSVGDLGRAHLVYGEWLRRVRRRRDAREQLRAALGIFERSGAVAFAGRARRELEATGEHVQASVPGGTDALTPREEAIARLAALGRTNAEIGAELFISANTVDYHLRKVFRKLGVTSRRQLAEHRPPV